jgi:hypothetical protein
MNGIGVEVSIGIGTEYLVSKPYLQIYSTTVAWRKTK